MSATRVCVGENILRAPPGAPWELLMDSGHCTFVHVDRFARCDRFGLDFESIAKSGQHLNDLADLEDAVFAGFLGRKVEIESDVFVAVGHFKDDLATVTVFAAARVNVPRILDDSDDIGSHLGIEVQERAFPNMKFLAHGLFLVVIAEKCLWYMRHLSQLGKAEKSCEKRFIVTRTLERKHSVLAPLIFENLIGRTEQTRSVNREVRTIWKRRKDSKLQPADSYSAALIPLSYVS
jgi:hypothetical protein